MYLYNNFIWTHMFIVKIGSDFFIHMKVNSNSCATQSLICPPWADLMIVVRI